MSVKKNMAGTPYLIWKEKPPGPEQKELERLFACKEINAATLPDSVRKSNELFTKFSAAVFSAHFRKTKAKFGLAAHVDIDGFAIPELGSAHQNIPSPASERFESLITDENAYDLNLPIEFRNPPYCTWTYTDHAKKTDFICVALPILSGINKTTFSLSEDGYKVILNYTWPTAIFKANELFGQAIKDKTMSITHPQIHSFVSMMLEAGITNNATPQAQTIIQLPCQVKREIGSWKQKAIKVNDTKIILLEFTAYQKALLVNDDDTTLNFD